MAVFRTHKDEYVRFAARCDELAQTASTQAARLDYQTRAALWRRLAEHRTDSGPTPFPRRALTDNWRSRIMATNEPTGDNWRLGAVKKRTQLKTKVMGKDAWTK